MSQPAPRGLSEQSEAAARQAVAAAALTNERAVSVVRALLFTAILIRFYVIASVETAAAVITLGALVGGIGFSLGVLWFVRRPPVGESLWLTSVAVDAGAMFLNLLPNGLWPSADFPGVLASPDTAAVFLTTIVAGLRLSPRAALWGTALNGSAVVALVMVDRWVSGDRFATTAGTVSLYLFWILGFGAVATILARASRRLAIRGAAAALRAEEARRGLWSVLGDHHDLRSLLTSAVVRAEALVSAPGRATDAERSAAVRKNAEQLNEDLDLIRRVVDEVKTRALGALDDQTTIEPVALGPAVESAVGRSRGRFADVCFEHEAPEGTPSVAVAGGEPALLRLLDNLLANAAEGDGQIHATTVTIRTDRPPDRPQIRLEVEDDGPGLPSDPSPDSEPPRSTKTGGTGVGLGVVRGIAEASGGSLRMGEGDGGGALATVTLPLA